MKPFLKLPQVVAPITTVACAECAGRGLIKLWTPGHPETAHMGRCEQCSGFGKVRA